MALIKSISGIRGTIGGAPDQGLTPIDIVKFTSSYGTFIKRTKTVASNTIIVGRDARISGPMVESLIVNTLLAIGFDVTNIGLATTPTVEVAVANESAAGGIIITASHNPRQWNALKLLNAKGEFLNGSDGEEILAIAAAEDFLYADIDAVGTLSVMENYEDRHIADILALPAVNIEAIKKAGFSVAIDCVNSVGGIALPKLLSALGVETVYELFTEPNGEFPHNPEPLPENLKDIANLVKEKKADLGFVVDPDVDRLAIVSEDGSMFGEEYTLVAVADYLLAKKSGNTVSNMSSSRALRDVTEQHGGTYKASAVGEVNVVTEMKATNAVIGGEGNGGVIYPELHYGRDALVGIALFLSHLAEKAISCSELRKSYPEYFISKNKIELTPEIDVDGILQKMAEKYQNENIDTIDGVKINFESEKEWVHLRKSNTEPIIRIYSESQDENKADELAQKIIAGIKSFI